MTDARPMGSRSSAEEGKIVAYRRAAEAMARGEFRPSLPAIVDGPAADELDRLGGALSSLGAALERKFAEANALIRLGEKVNAGLVLEEILDQIFDSFQSIIPYDRIGCSMLEDEGRTVQSDLGSVARCRTQTGNRVQRTTCRQQPGPDHRDGTSAHNQRPRAVLARASPVATRPSSSCPTERARASPVRSLRKASASASSSSAATGRTPTPSTTSTCSC